VVPEALTDKNPYEKPMTLNEILLTLKKRFWLVGAGALIAGVVALVLSLVWPPTYEAEALLLIAKLRPSVTLNSGFQTVSEEDIVNLSIQDDQVRRQTLLGLTSSRDLTLQVVAHLGDTLPPEQRSVGYLNSVTDASTRGNLIVLTARARSPDAAASLANGWAEVYQEHVNRLYGVTTPTYEQVQVEMSSAQIDYETAKRAYEAYLRTSTEDELTRQIDQKTQILADLQATRLAAARQRVAALLARTNQIDQLLLDAQSLQLQLEARSAENLSADDSLLTDGEGFALFTLQAMAFSQGTTYPTTLEIGQGWPREADLTTGQAVDQLELLVGALETVRIATQTETDGVSSSLLEGEDLLDTGAHGAGTAGVTQLQGEINDLQAEVQRVTAEKQDLFDARTLAREAYLTLLRKASEVEILSKLTGAEVRIAANAVPPPSPSFPRPLLSTALGVIAGGLAGLALAFGVELWPRTRPDAVQA
jgi:uncharacterized protein involved in exopolysaccharide biosynthesis